MNVATLGLAFLAGLLSILSPCVLPLLPLVLGAAATEHKWGPALLALGVTLSFVAIGLFVATVGFSIGLDGGKFSFAAALLMIVFGAALAVPAVGAQFAAAAGPLSNWLDATLSRASAVGGLGAFGLGLTLGAVWSPCVGPTLGATSALAARGDNLGQVALTMTAFGFGSAIPLLVLGGVSRGAMLAWRGHLLGFSAFAKQALGVMLFVIGAAILLGVEKKIEAVLVSASPEWLTQLTTRY